MIHINNFKINGKSGPVRMCTTVRFDIISVISIINFYLHK